MDGTVHQFSVCRYTLWRICALYLSLYCDNLTFINTLYFDVILFLAHARDTR